MHNFFGRKGERFWIKNNKTPLMMMMMKMKKKKMMTMKGE